MRLTSLCAAPQRLCSTVILMQASRLVDEHVHNRAGADIAEAMQQHRAMRKASRSHRDQDSS